MEGEGEEREEEKKEERKRQEKGMVEGDLGREQRGTWDEVETMDREGLRAKKKKGFIYPDP